MTAGDLNYPASNGLRAETTDSNWGRVCKIGGTAAPDRVGADLRLEPSLSSSRSAGARGRLVYAFAK